MGRNTKAVAYALGGVVLAVAMSLGAFAIAGSALSDPAPTIRIVRETQTPQPHPSESDHAATSTPTASASSDDHGGDDHGGGDDNSGPGGGDD
jgi:hypothetical protein